MKTHLGNAWTQCASWYCSCPSWLGGRSRNSKIHPQMSGGTDRDLVVLWFGLNCESWNLFYDDGKIGTSLFLKSHSYDGNFFFGLDGCDIYGFAKLSWNQAQASIQGIHRRKHWGNALLQCAAWGALSDSLLVGRYHNRKIHLQMLKYTGRDLVDAWWYLKHGWIRLSV